MSLVRVLGSIVSPRAALLDAVVRKHLFRCPSRAGPVKGYERINIGSV